MVDSILLKLQVLNEEEKLNKNLELIEEGIERLYNEGSISLKKAESLKKDVSTEKQETPNKETNKKIASPSSEDKK